MIGQTLGHYKILELLGKGGMGEVYRAEDTTLGREIAIKVLPPELAQNRERLDRFQREAKALAALDHPSIVTVFTVEQAQDIHFLTMQLVRGKRLSDLLAEEGLPVERVLGIAIPMVDALRAAHEKGIIHRDLKPENVMANTDGRVKILDFGLAKLRLPEFVEADREAPTQAMTEAGMVMGTMPYMSPEQVQGNPVDHRTDIFSLGIILYEMACGARPFKGENSASLISSIMRDDPEPVAAVKPGLPQRLVDAIHRCLAKNRDERYTSADELYSELLEVQDELKAGRAAVARPESEVSQPQISSLAVLPLRNLSGDPQQDYFVDGMTEALIIDLSKIGALKVISRSSAMRYKNTDKPLAKIARELDVQALIEGSVLREADQVRVSAQMIEAATDRNLWADRYDREISSILALQSEVAQAIAREIQVTLTPGEQALLGRARTVNPEAYDAFLKGMFHWYELTPADLNTALHYFELALQKDPNYAPAHVGIFQVWAGRQQMELAAPSEAGPRAREAALRAVELDDTLAEAHNALAGLKAWTDWDWVGAEAAFQRALDLDANFAYAHAGYSHLLANIGRTEKAVQHSQRAIELDPFNALWHAFHGVVLSFDRQYDLAHETFRRALELQPDNPVAVDGLQWLLMTLGMRDEKLETQRKYIVGFPERIAAFERGLMEDGYEGAQRRVADLMVAQYEKAGAVFTPSVGPLSAFGIGLQYLDAGNHCLALDWLIRSLEDRDPSMTYLRHPVLEPLRNDPRFQDLLRRMNLPS